MYAPSGFKNVNTQYIDVLMVYFVGSELDTTRVTSIRSYDLKILYGDIDQTVIICFNHFDIFSRFECTRKRPFALEDHIAFDFNGDANVMRSRFQRDSAPTVRTNMINSCLDAFTRGHRPGFSMKPQNRVST